MAIDVFEALRYEIERSFTIWDPVKAMVNNSADIGRWKEKGAITQEQANDLESMNRKAYWVATTEGGQDVHTAAEG